MQLILDTLERARLTASPSDAMTLADAIADLEALDAAMDRNGWTLDETPAALDGFDGSAFPDGAVMRTRMRSHA